MVAGTGSGSGKTLTALALLAGLGARGRDVRPFKCGPDFIDPRYHEWIAGVPSFNLDRHFSPPDVLEDRFARLTRGSSGGVVEGVMGLYDGLERGTSTFDIARILGLPVLLVVNAQGMAESLAAVVSGMARFREGLRVLGVVATRTGSERHRTILSRALSEEGLPPLAGVLPRHERLALPERHLGLFGPDDLDAGVLSPFRETLAGFAASQFDWPLIETAFAVPEEKTPAPPEHGAAARSPSFVRAMERSVALLSSGMADPPKGRRQRRLKMGVALDRAFWFYYPENWAAFARHGIDPVFFSPLADPALPPRIDGLYLGGGYPEAHADRLSRNETMRAGIREFAAGGRPLYAECGGMLYLTCGPEGGQAPWVGLIPSRVVPGARLTRLGYAEVEPMPGPGLFCGATGAIRGHLFHYSSLVAEAPEPGTSVRPPLSPAFRHLPAGTGEGFSGDGLVASYVHLFFPSNDSWVESLAHAMADGRA